VRAAFRHVNLRVDPDIILEIRELDGALVSVRPGHPPVFDDQQSFVLHIDVGEIALSTASLTNLLNHHVFTGEDAPLEDLEVTVVEGKLHQKGKLRKGVDIPFSVLAEVSVTDDGRIRLHPVKTKAIGLPAGGLMKFFGLELDELIKVKRTPGVTIVDNDFLLDPDRLLPAPRIAGRLTGVRIEGDRIVQTFGRPGDKGAPLTPPDARARNYMYYRGGVLQFGKLTMHDADLQLVDADPRDPFDFFPSRYVEQLVAGYSKNTPSGGLKVYMPDYARARGSDLRPR
jgi:hypothetical protein